MGLPFLHRGCLHISLCLFIYNSLAYKYLLGHKDSVSSVGNTIQIGFREKKQENAYKK
jgi:hypothetical protein